MFYSREHSTKESTPNCEFPNYLAPFFTCYLARSLSERSDLLLDSTVAAKLSRVLMKQRSPSKGILRFPRPNAPRIPPRTTLRTSDVLDRIFIVLSVIRLGVRNFAMIARQFQSRS